MYVIVFLLISMLLAISPVAAQTTAASEYHLTVDTESLRKLDSDPWANDYVPAVITVEGIEYACEARYRGGSTRGAPKKSWRIKFENADNPFGVEKLNLTAQYYDQSLLRHYLAMKLFGHLGQATPAVRHANLYLNGNYAGVYVEVENVDSGFFTRRSLRVDALFKGENHASRFVHLLDDQGYRTAWGQEIGDVAAYQELMSVMSSLMYVPDDQFAAYVNQHFDVQQVLTYFAVEYALAAHDNITKNYFLYRSADDQRYRLVPWDNDAILGNDFQGVYDSLGFALSYRGSLFRNNHLLQRMLDVPQFRADYALIVQSIIGEGFDYMATLADAEVLAIRDDVYRDVAKCCSNENFEQGLGEIDYFLAKRRSYLLNTAPSPHEPPQELSCSHAFAHPGDTVVFRVDATHASESSFYVDLARDVDFTWGDSIDFTRLELYDDGLHSDGVAGDRIYGNSIALPQQAQAVMPYVFLSSKRDYPAGGFAYVAYQPLWTPAIVFTEAAESDYAQLQLVDAVKVENDYALIFVNNSDRVLDLSYSAIRADSPYLHWCLPPGVALAPKETLVVTTNVPLARQLLPPAIIVGTMFSPVHTGDTLALLGPDARVLAEYSVPEVRAVDAPVHPVIINEIQYSSSADKQDGGDWVELYNPSSTELELDGWVLKDAEDDHAFMFRAGTTVEPHGYIVVCVDTTSFDAAYPVVKNRAGNMDFAFGDNDAVRLFDVAGRLIDMVEYRDTAPWPGVSDAGGPTLELISPVEDNTLPLHWRISMLLHGTPGRENSVADRDSTGTDLPVVISEINYRAPESLDAGDWVELYNPAEQSVDIGQWILTDEESDHVFRFPIGLSIAPKSYVVAVRRTERFRAIHPGVDEQQIAGPIGFGFSGDGGEIRLLNVAGVLVDSVRYGVTAPWPVLPADGATLELLDVAMDNALPESWALSLSPAGTPAAPNSTRPVQPPATKVADVRVGPNPVQDVVSVDIALAESGTLNIELFDVQGRKLATVFRGEVSSGYRSFLWDASSLPPGWFALRFWYNNTVLAVKPFVKM